MGMYGQLLLMAHPKISPLDYFFFTTGFITPTIKKKIRTYIHILQNNYKEI